MTNSPIDAALSTLLACGLEGIINKEAAASLAVADDQLAESTASEILSLDTRAIDAFEVGPELKRPAVAWKLLDSLDAERYHWNPERLLAVAKLAYVIASSRPSSAMLEFIALKEQATALKLLFRFDDAHRTLDRAAIVARRTSSSVVNLAIVDYARAGVCCDAQQRQDALILLHRAQAVFRSTGEDRRLEQSKSLEATILFGLGRYEDACVIYEAALSSAVARNDNQRMAMEVGNIGHCCMMLRETEAARGYLSMAAEMYAAEGMGIGQATALRALGRLTIREAGADEEEEILQASTIFERLGLIGQWCLTRLALAEELLEFAPDADVDVICQEALNRAVDARIGVITASALALLSHAAKQRDVTPDFVREVSCCIDPSAITASANER
ncbi:MAG TPA: hypothetical protein VLC46_20350 [Thermoanaerobaculia bacterium]|jgi:tetratricopeptide (TPR) repeat protein|nr:hypothetical protein [Thermoanaerobaculia bacterium]